jgi:hypothetical protein
MYPTIISWMNIDAQVFSYYVNQNVLGFMFNSVISLAQILFLFVPFFHGVILDFSQKPLPS